MIIIEFNCFVDNSHNYANIILTWSFDVLSDHSFANERQYYNDALLKNDKKKLVKNEK